MVSKTGTPIFYISGPIPTLYDRVKEQFTMKLNSFYSFIIAVCMVIVNFLFPFIKRTVCEISVDRPNALKRAFNFVLRASYVLGNDSLEEVNATIKCIKIPSDKRDYQSVFSKFFFLGLIILYTLIIFILFAVVAVVAALFIALLVRYGRGIWARYNHLPVLRNLNQIAFPFPNLREMGIDWYNRLLQLIDWLY